MPEIRTLAQIRQKAGKSMIEAAEALGVTKQAYWRKEKGLRRLQIDEAKVLAGLFAVSVEDVAFSSRKVTNLLNASLMEQA